MIRARIAEKREPITVRGMGSAMVVGSADRGGLSATVDVPDLPSISDCASGEDRKPAVES